MCTKYQLFISKNIYFSTYLQLIFYFGVALKVYTISLKLIKLEL